MSAQHQVPLNRHIAQTVACICAAIFLFAMVTR